MFTEYCTNIRIQSMRVIDGKPEYKNGFDVIAKVNLIVIQTVMDTGRGVFDCMFPCAFIGGIERKYFSVVIQFVFREDDKVQLKSIHIINS